MIDFDNEAKGITDELKLVEGYLDCEVVIIHNLKKHVDKGIADVLIEGYMKKLYNHFEVLIKSTQNRDDCINYRYSAGFLNTLILTPFWRSWIKTINL